MKDLCNVAAGVEGIQQHPVAAHEDAHSTACTPEGLQKDSRLNFSTLALVRHGLDLWKNRARGRAWCLRLGMTASSWDGWAKMHVHPLVAMQFFFLSTMVDILSRSYMLTGLPMDGSLLCHAVTLPHNLNIAVCVAGTCAMFRVGPQVVFHRMFPLLVLATVSLALPLWYVGYIGPQDTVPWNNRFKFLVYGSVHNLFSHLAGAAGWLPGEHPVEPRTSIRKPVYSAIIKAMRLCDSLTDMSLIAELVAEVRLCSILWGCTHSTKGSRCSGFASIRMYWCCTHCILDGFSLESSRFIGIGMHRVLVRGTWVSAWHRGWRSLAISVQQSETLIFE